MPDAHEAFRKQMQQEAPQELIVRQTGELLFVVVRRIAPAESDLAIAEGDQAMVGDGHAVGVAAEILQDIFWATEGRFQVHHPGFSIQRAKPGGEDLGVRECLKFSGKRSSPFRKACRRAATNLPRKTLRSTPFGRK